MLLNNKNLNQIRSLSITSNLFSDSNILGGGTPPPPEYLRLYLSITLKEMSQWENINTFSTSHREWVNFCKLPPTHILAHYRLCIMFNNKINKMVFSSLNKPCIDNDSSKLQMEQQKQKQRMNSIVWITHHYRKNKHFFLNLVPG